MPELADEAGETALHAVAHTGTLEHLQLCLTACRSLSADAALHLRTQSDESLLHYAAAGGRKDIVEFLLHHGFDVNSRTANGWTPLICALTPTKVKPEKWDGVAPLTWDLIARGAPLDAEPLVVLRYVGVTRMARIETNVWGIRMRWLIATETSKGARERDRDSSRTSESPF
ncbi:hypothetical protein N0V88_003102 [Collariella sp. IMI 366227]|nr:hypothetical protein N0V88_003102 [Collariella sp. IMI 366227]